MKRMHIHVAVDDLSASVGFYSKLFASEPSVVKSDYAKWMLDDPRVNFAISRRGMAAGLNHLGMQVESAEELEEIRGRLATFQTGIETQTEAACCYAKSDKHWITDPSGIAWESFHTLESIPVFGQDALQENPEQDCCIPLAASAGEIASPCCVPLKESALAGKCC